MTTPSIYGKFSPGSLQALRGSSVNFISEGAASRVDVPSTGFVRIMEPSGRLKRGTISGTKEGCLGDLGGVWSSSRSWETRWPGNLLLGVATPGKVSMSPAGLDRMGSAIGAPSMFGTLGSTEVSLVHGLRMRTTLSRVQGKGV